MKFILKYAIAVSAASIVLKLVIFFAGLQFAAVGTYDIYIIFLLVLIGVFHGMRAAKSASGNIQNLRENIHTGCKIAALNALVMSVFTYIYYRYIDTGYFPEKIKSTLLLMKKNGYSFEQMFEYSMNARLLFFAPDKVATFTLFGYLLLGGFYAVIAGFILRKFSVQ